MTCRWMAAAAAAALVSTACSKPVPAKLPAAADTGMAAAPSHGPITLTLADYSISAPASLPAGYTTFKTVNTGKQLHQAALVRLDSGKTAEDFANAMKSNGPPPTWITWLGGPQQGTEVTLQLVPGTYVWYCAIPGPDGVSHLAKGMMAPMAVTAAADSAGGTPPAADIDVTMRDYQWDLSTPITAGHHILKVTNAGPQGHEMVMVRLAAGKTAKDVIAWVDKQVGPPPVESLAGIASLGIGQVNYVAYDFTPGQYALLCFVPDARDGKPHVAHGMVKEFTVQ